MMVEPGVPFPITAPRHQWKAVILERKDLLKQGGVAWERKQRHLVAKSGATGMEAVRAREFRVTLAAKGLLESKCLARVWANGFSELS